MKVNDQITGESDDVTCGAGGGSFHTGAVPHSTAVIGEEQQARTGSDRTGLLLCADDGGAVRNSASMETAAARTACDNVIGLSRNLIIHLHPHAHLPPSSLANHRQWRQLRGCWR